MTTGYTCPDDVLTDYLDHLCAPLVGVVPFAERARLREETQYHLERLYNGYLLDGVSPMEAAFQAVQKYGGSQEVAHLFLETWFAHQPQGQLARHCGQANLRALVPFGIATLVTTGLVQLRVYLPAPEPLTFGLSVAQIRQVLPEPLPLPDASPLSVWLALCTLIAPWIAGFWTGTLIPVRPVRAVYGVQLLLTLYTFVLGFQMLPTREGLFLGLVQIFYWLPVGCLAAQVASVLTWRRNGAFRCSYSSGKGA